ncbi:type II toxin-antitoxin system tRNA(fMet)-specific endonuclease VapC [Francisella sp. XLW-1]|uniref:type II toxin-antitoxin system tRNA(fMet)-specific endonuclease VapC n=1 Tax=Francisella sp. XLW-1 TaxID=2610887 RepID=UPI00123E1F16|nr:type II toxin-antitoxin system VapC family toxin [Francisella sp. XLW-1]
MKVMLDTNICIYILKEQPKSVLEHFKKYEMGDICISSIVYAELLHGAFKSKWINQNLTNIHNFVAALQIVDFNRLAAVEYGKIRSDLEKAGKIIGANDLLIAAHAKSLNVPLATNNIKEFQRVEDLVLLNWV